MDTFELRFLGEMQVLRGGRRLDLPPSKKTRGLLAYLALTPRPHRRDRLTGLLWDVADDPRGALRWSLSRLRALVDEPDRARIRATRDQVAFEPAGARIDILDLEQRCAAGLENLAVDDLVGLAGQFRGELLEGLDFDDFLDFQAWCVAKREEARKLHAAVLRSLVVRLANEPEAALPHARTLVDVDPLDEAARAGLVRLLGTTGRRLQAEQQFQAGTRLLRELGRPSTGALESAWTSAREAKARPAGAARAADPEPVPAPPPHAGNGLVGRQRERAQFERVLDDTLRGRRERVLLLTGEPGLGKSRLLGALCARVRERGGTVLEGRAFEVEARRPFGPWVDALRQLPVGTVSASFGDDLGTLLPELSRVHTVPQSRDRLFGAVLELLSARTTTSPPVLLAFDDAQWLDAASAELVHYVARMSRNRPLLVVLTARAGELSDNETVQTTLRGLRDLGLLEEIALAPLGPGETHELTASLAPDLDAARVFAESGGNPLLALEVARSPLADGAPLSRTLTELIRNRVDRLPSEAGDVLRWAAVLGSAFDVGRLNALVSLDLDRLLAALELLERHALLRAQAASGDGAGNYVFAHELVRRAVYSDLSQPRRRLMHLRIAENLQKTAVPDTASSEAVAAELAHHAALAGENALAARACAAAGQRFLRQFANQEAWAMARRGRRHAAEVSEPERTRLLIRLLQVEHQARRPTDLPTAAAELEVLAERALEHGCTEDARQGFHTLAYLRWEEGDFPDARRHMMRAEVVSRAAGDEKAQVIAMAEAARCLVLLESDLQRAQALVEEARARSARLGVRASVLTDAQAMLRQHEGRVEEAGELYERARLEARQAADAMAEFQALEHLVTLRQELGDWKEALRLGIDLAVLADKLREGSEAPFAGALLALSRHALGDALAAPVLEAAFEELRLVDAKLRLAYTLTRAARIDLAHGDPARARTRAEEACRTVAPLARPTESLLASATWIRARRALGEDVDVQQVLDDLGDVVLNGASRAARTEMQAILEEWRSGRPLSGAAADGGEAHR